MLGERSPQVTLFDASHRLGPEAVKAMGFYGQLAQVSSQLFRDQDFQDLYCPDNGRPSIPPSLLALARLLQCYVGISDAETVNCCRFDLRWKVALGLELEDTQAPFSRAAFQVFRARLTLHEREGLAFERSLAMARESKLLSGKALKVALDSSPVHGRGAVKDTYNLMSDGIGAVLRALADQSGAKPREVAATLGLERHLERGSVKGSADLDWSNADEVTQFLNALIADSDRVLKQAEALNVQGVAVDLLKKILAQDIERGDDEGSGQIRRGVAKDRVVSVTDPEMRHGCKSSGAKYNGHKAHVAVDVDSTVITAVTLGAPGEADGEQVKTLLEQTRAETQADVDVALGDCAYASRSAASQAAELDVEMCTRMPGPRRGWLNPQDFEVSDDRLTARCPAGHLSIKQRTRRRVSQSDIEHRWSEDHCGACPLRARCTTAKGRTLLVPLDFHDRRRRERWTRSPEGRRELRKRTLVEHAIARIKNRGGGQARYMGRAKTEGQWLWTAAVVNLSLIFARKPEFATQ